jgi:hypothetical protein
MSEKRKEIENKIRLLGALVLLGVAAVAASVLVYAWWVR